MYERKIRNDYSLCDFRGNLSVKSIMEITENNTADLFGIYGCDNISLKEKYNLMWVFVKYKAKFFGSIRWGREFITKTYISLLKKVKCITVTDFYDMDGNLIASVFLESCMLDISSRRIVKIEESGFPMDHLVIHKEVPPMLGREEDGFLPIWEYQVKNQDIDFSLHINNISYITFALNTYSLKELMEKRITGLEIYYLEEGKYGDLLKIYKKELDSRDIFSIRNENEIFQMSLEYEV